MTFWCGSGSRSVDTCLGLKDPNPDSDPDEDPYPAIFVIHLQDANKNIILKIFPGYYFLKVHFTACFKDKKSKRSYKAVGIKGFLTIFAW